LQFWLCLAGAVTQPATRSGVRSRWGNYGHISWNEMLQIGRWFPPSSNLPSSGSMKRHERAPKSIKEHEMKKKIADA
jgi:hypothetical protein